MRVLLVGAGGNIGSRLLPALISHHHTVVAYVRDISRLSTQAREIVVSIVVADAKDASSLVAAILENGCDAVVNCAGWAAMTGLQDQGEFPQIFAAVLKAVTDSGKQRNGKPIRLWSMSSFFTLDAPVKPYLFGDYIPLFPAHRPNYHLIEDVPASSVAWSLLCPNRPLPRHDVAQFPFPEDSSAANLVAAAGAAPDWQEWYHGFPLLGSWLNVILQARSYYVKMEDCVDFIAADLEKGLQSDWIGHRVGLKERLKAL